MATLQASSDRSLAEINITPLVDVMLVLLVIFMLAAPTMTRSLELDLPQPNPDASPPPAVVTVRIDASGQLFWEGVPDSLDGIATSMRGIGAAPLDQQPQLVVDASPDADYGAVARVLAKARNAGVGQLGVLGECRARPVRVPRSRSGRRMPDNNADDNRGSVAVCHPARFARALRQQRHP